MVDFPVPANPLSQKTCMSCGPLAHRIIPSRTDSRVPGRHTSWRPARYPALCTGSNFPSHSRSVASWQWSQSSDKPGSSPKSPHNNVLDIFTNLLRLLVNSLSIFAHLPGVFTYLLCVFVSVLLHRCLPEMLDSLCGGIGCTHLVIRHGGSQVPDETVQDFGMINVLQKFHDPMLLGKRSELRHYTIQSPANSQCDLETCQFCRREVITDPLRASLRAVSPSSRSPTGDLSTFSSD